MFKSSKEKKESKMQNDWKTNLLSPTQNDRFGSRKRSARNGNAASIVSEFGGSDS